MPNFKKKKKKETEIYEEDNSVSTFDSLEEDKMVGSEEGSKKRTEIDREGIREKLKRGQKRTRYVTQQVCNGSMASTRNKRFRR